jgi:hypothetical protein
MFERYTEKARRVIFFARYEASKFGSRMIETDICSLHSGKTAIWQNAFSAGNRP